MVIFSQWRDDSEMLTFSQWGRGIETFIFKDQRLVPATKLGMSHRKQFASRLLFTNFSKKTEILNSSKLSKRGWGKYFFHVSECVDHACDSG